MSDDRIAALERGMAALTERVGRLEDAAPAEPLDSLNDVYAERNAVVLAFARMAEDEGWPVAQVVDSTEPDWPVLLIETPYGQVSWHLRRCEMPSDIPTAVGWHWDGHTTAEKYARLARLVRREVSIS
jgi:hypothetical protein